MKSVLNVMLPEPSNELQAVIHHISQTLGKECTKYFAYAAIKHRENSTQEHWHQTTGPSC